MNHTNATKALLSEMRRGERNPMYGRKHTPEALAKISAATRKHNLKRQYAISPQRVRIPEGVALGYFAGLIDGEGSIRFHRDRPFVAVYGERPVVEWLVANVGGAFGKPDERGRVPCYAWSVSAARDVEAICRAVVSLLNIKAGDALIALAHIEEKYGEVVAGG